MVHMAKEAEQLVQWARVPRWQEAGLLTLDHSFPQTTETQSILFCYLGENTMWEESLQ